VPIPYVPDEDFFRGPGDVHELGPDETGTMIDMSGDGIHRVMRFSAGGVNEE